MSIPLTEKEVLDKISANAEKLTGEEGMLELNPENDSHKEWFEDDGYTIVEKD